MRPKWVQASEKDEKHRKSKLKSSIPSERSKELYFKGRKCLRKKVAVFAFLPKSVMSIIYQPQVFPEKFTKNTIFLTFPILHFLFVKKTSKKL